jgi:hypothetical protein
VATPDQFIGIGDVLAKLGMPLDDGVSPVPVEGDGHNVLVDKARDYLQSWVPEGDEFAAVDEYGTGLAEGAVGLANIVPNIGNSARNLFDLHFGSGQGLAEEDRYQPWMDEPEFDAPRPGWEGVRETGQITGGAAPLALAGPAGILAATVGVPALTKGGGVAGEFADKLTGNEDTHKWEQTGEALAPLLSGALRVTKGSPVGTLAKKIPLTKGGGLAAVTGTVSPQTALAALAAKLGIQGMDRVVVGKPKGLVKDTKKAIGETGATMQTSEERR